MEKECFLCRSCQDFPRGSFGLGHQGCILKILIFTFNNELHIFGQRNLVQKFQPNSHFFAVFLWKIE